jgi:hypothetical protein
VRQSKWKWAKSECWSFWSFLEVLTGKETSFPNWRPWKWGNTKKAVVLSGEWQGVLKSQS